jgi:hypothetical protein
MRQVDAEELGGGAIYPIWKLMEMQQLGVQSSLLMDVVQLKFTEFFYFPVLFFEP